MQIEFGVPGIWSAWSTSSKYRERNRVVFAKTEPIGFQIKSPIKFYLTMIYQARHKQDIRKV